MSKIMFFTDVHVRPTSPKSRKDDFYETIMRKLEWVIDKGNELGVDAFVCGGDLLDRPDATYQVLTELMGVLTKAKAPIYTVLGNHDIFGYNPATHSRTGLYIPATLGILRRLSDEPEIVGDYAITGVDSHHLLDRNGRVSDYVDVKRVDGKINVRVVHGFLAEREWPMVPSTGVANIANTNADIILTGHEHTGFYKEVAGKKFCNPGALARVSASVGDVNQVVKVALLDGPDISYVSLPSDIARPADEVLDREALELEKASQAAMRIISDSTREVVKDVKTIETDYIQALINLREKGEISERVEAYIREEVEKAEMELSKEVN